MDRDTPHGDGAILTSLRCDYSSYITCSTVLDHPQKLSKLSLSYASGQYVIRSTGIIYRGSPNIELHHLFYRRPHNFLKIDLSQYMYLIGFTCGFCLGNPNFVLHRLFYRAGPPSETVDNLLTVRVWTVSDRIYRRFLPRKSQHRVAPSILSRWTILRNCSSPPL